MPVEVILAERFAAHELTEMQRLAVERRGYAIVVRTTSSHRSTQREAEDANQLKNHVIGIAAEYAVTWWLSDSRIVVRTNFKDVAADFGGAPDIETEPPTMRCDVKSSYDRYPESQRGSLERKDVVIWCWARPADSLLASEERIQKHVVEIYGWTSTLSIQPLKAGSDGWINVPRELVDRDLDALLARLRA
jgi:hypothetical protein